jgi:hypothetical protein
MLIVADKSGAEQCQSTDYDGKGTRLERDDEIRSRYVVVVQGACKVRESVQDAIM